MMLWLAGVVALHAPIAIGYSIVSLDFNIANAHGREFGRMGVAHTVCIPSRCSTTDLQSGNGCVYIVKFLSLILMNSHSSLTTNSTVYIASGVCD